MVYFVTVRNSYNILDHIYLNYSRSVIIRPCYCHLNGSLAYVVFYIYIEYTYIIYIVHHIRKIICII